MTLKVRLGIFILVVALLCAVFVCGKEKQAIEKLGASEITVVENIQTPNSFCFETELFPREIIKTLNAKLHSKQFLENENLEIYYCFVENINNFIVCNNKKVNLQIAFNGEKSIVGFPIIQTGY